MLIKKSNLKYKSIKKLIKILLIFLLSVAVIPATAYFLLQNNKIQNYIAKIATSKLTSIIGSKVTIGDISFDIFNQLVLNKVYVEDIHHDTLLYSKSITLAVDEINIEKRIIAIEKVELYNAHFRLYIDSTYQVNLKYVIDKFTGGTSDSTKRKWDVKFNNIGLIDSRFTLQNFHKNPCDTGINFTNLRLHDLNVRVKNLAIKSKVASFNINKLSFIEHSGFTVNNLSAKMSIGKHMMHFNNVLINTPRSDVDAPKVYFDFSDISNFSYFAQRVTVLFQINRSKANFADISFFAPPLWGMGEEFIVSGTARGKICDLRCKQLLFKTGKSTSFSGNISLTGLPKLKETFIYIDSKRLYLNLSELENYYIPTIPNNKIIIPDYLKKAEYIDFAGNFTGFLNDFVAYGVFRTKVGVIKSDLSLKPEPNKSVAFNGKITAEQFNVGGFLSKENLMGTANFNINAYGSIDENQKINGSLDGEIGQFAFNNYTYSDIKIKGDLQDNLFNGSVLLDDKNIKLDIQGQFNLNPHNQEYNFTANLDKANLLKLNFLPKDSIEELSSQISANFKGNNINDFDGEIILNKASFVRKDKKLAINNFKLSSNNSSQNNKIEINSSILDAEIVGRKNINTFVNSLIHTLKIYLPSSFRNTKFTEPLDANDFSFNIVLKNTKPLLDFFSIGIAISNNSTVKGNYNPSNSAFYVDLKSENIQFGQNKFEKLHIKGTGKRDSLLLVINSEKLYLGEQINLSQFQLKSNAQSDSVKTHISWSNNQKQGGSSNIYSLASYSQSKQKSNPILNIELLPAQIYPIDSLWSIKEFSLSIDTTSVFVHGITLNQGKQTFQAQGKVSENPADTLSLSFKNFDLQNLQFFLKNNQFYFSGLIDGTASLNDFYKARRINSEMQIAKFSINGEVLGNTNISTKWNNEIQKVFVKADAFKNDYKSIHVDGYFNPENKELNFDLEAEKVGLKLFQPSVESIFILNTGNFSGKLTLKGNLKKPLLEGDLDINNALLTIKYLKTIYRLTTQLKIRENNFILNDVKLLDRDKNTCIVNGVIYNKYFSEFSLKLSLLLDNTMVLNTFASDNNPFYGKAYASGTVNIYGNPQNINIDVPYARTEKNTVIAIPLNKKNDIQENNFLSFVGSKKINVDSINNPKKYEVNLSGIKLNFNLEVTPDAEIQLVFDPKMGDIMRSHGHSNIKLEINTIGDFKMRGDYVVESGDYMFTLQNLINKKFILQPGGVISWNDNPTDANLDVKAIYKTKAALFNLTGDPSPEYKKRIPIDCQLFITGKLLNPEIKYNLYLPNSAEETRSKLRDYVYNEEELSKQFLSLLVINNFLPTTTVEYASSSSSSVGRDLGITTSYELLSSQLSNWLSQVNKNVDVGFSYRPGEKNLTGQEVEVALSTQLLDDRISINGNFDMVGNPTATATTTNSTSANKYVGEVNVEFKLTDKLKLKAFNHANEQILIEQSPYTQGIGVNYREEFTTLGELRRRYFRMLFVPKKDTAVVKENKEIKNKK